MCKPFFYRLAYMSNVTLTVGVARVQIWDAHLKYRNLKIFFRMAYFKTQHPSLCATYAIQE